MTMTRILESAFLSCALLCAGLATAQTPDPALQAVLSSSFRAEGIAGLDRINQDPIQALCSDPSMKSSPQGQAKMEALQKASLAEIKPRLMQQLQQQMVERHLADLRAKAKIE